MECCNVDNASSLPLFPGLPGSLYGGTDSGGNGRCLPEGHRDQPVRNWFGGPRLEARPRRQGGLKPKLSFRLPLLACASAAALLAAPAANAHETGVPHRQAKAAVAEDSTSVPLFENLGSHSLPCHHRQPAGAGLSGRLRHRSPTH
ncbi:hypothetical protein MES4922_110211 [Mesorhizobium ventifaucium]|uniref:Uncharacterized protein n=1 Tax=Mesorhizobium ventifaucium TaxID=666020 RepID=A0ABN8J9G1_9HYPH|nr:hypothetical protein MES4922_110211 [Mesorhizobium ventifaucium]